MAKFSPIEPLDFTRPGTWPKWKARFARYRIATKLDKDDESVQVNALVYSMGPEAENVFKAFQFADAADSNKYEPVLAKYDSYFTPKKNIVHE